MLPTPCHLIIWPQKACRVWSHCSNTAVLKRRWAEACSQSNGLGKLADFDSEDTDWFVVEMTYYPFILRKTINKSVFTVLVVTTYLFFKLPFYYFLLFAIPKQEPSTKNSRISWAPLISEGPSSSRIMNFKLTNMNKIHRKIQVRNTIIEEALKVIYIYICAIIYMR